MTDSATEELAEVPVNEDPLYADLVPIPQDDGPNPVVLIRYTKKFILVHNYFRALLQKDEKSERALKLSSKVIALNAANYTAWQYRRDILFTLDLDLFEELRFCQKVAEASPKNYQLWWHRRIIIQAINDPSSKPTQKKTPDTDAVESNANNNRMVNPGIAEADADAQASQPQPQALLNDDNDDGNGHHNKTYYDMRLEKNLIRKILRSDAKNYHAWSHLHWILRTYPQLFDDELQYLEEELLRLDVRNNSAWNHRHFVIENTVKYESLAVLQSEIAFCQKKIKRIANNDSVWYYYSDVVFKQLKRFAVASASVSASTATASESQSESERENVESLPSWNELRHSQMAWVQQLLKAQPYSNRAILFYVDLLTEAEYATYRDLNQAIELLTLLADKIDRIRHNYYKYLITGVNQQIQALNNSN